MTIISYAQNFEDVILLRALNQIEHGFYVDVGANDPYKDSVTYAFYKRGWHGINIEPLQALCEKLKNERPFDINLCIAAGASVQEKPFFAINETGLSTFDPTIAELKKEAGWQVTENQMKVEPLNEILEKYCSSPIHFLKIDVEGSEESVIRGLDLKRWRPWILLIEATVPGSPNVQFSNWEPLVTQENYHFVYFDGINRFYLANEHLDLSEAFLAPPNVFDQFMKIDELNRIELIKQQDDSIQALETEKQQTAQKLDTLNAQLQTFQIQFAQVNSDLINAHAQNFKLVQRLSESQTRELGFAEKLSSSQTNEIELAEKLSLSQVKTLEFAEKLTFSQTKALELAEKLSLSQVKTLEFAEKLTFSQTKALELAEKLALSQSKVAELMTELKYANTKGLSEAAFYQSRVKELSEKLSQTLQELDKVYHSRSYRLTSPLRGIFGFGRVVRDRLGFSKKAKRYSIMQKLEPVTYDWVLSLRRISIYVQFKTWVKKRFPALWHLVRRVFLPSYVKTEMSYAEHFTRSNIAIQDKALSLDEQHYFDLFQREMMRQVISSEENQ